MHVQEYIIEHKYSFQFHCFYYFTYFNSVYTFYDAEIIVKLSKYNTTIMY